MAIKNPYIRSERSILILHLLEKRMILAQLKSSSEYSVALTPLPWHPEMRQSRREVTFDRLYAIEGPI